MHLLCEFKEAQVAMPLMSSLISPMVHGRSWHAMAV